MERNNKNWLSRNVPELTDNQFYSLSLLILGLIALTLSFIILGDTVKDFFVK